MIASWVLLPAVALRIGPERYGWFTFYLSILSTIAVADAGLGSAIVRRTAEVVNTHGGLSRTLAKQCFALYSLIGAGIAATVVLLLRGGSVSAENTWVLTGAGIMCGLQIALAPAARFLAGLGEYHRWMTFGIVSNLCLVFVLVGVLGLPSEFAIVTLIIGHSVSLTLAPALAFRRVAQHIRSVQAHSEDSGRHLHGIWREACRQLPIILFGTVQREFPKWGLIIVFPMAELGRLGVLLAVLTGVGGLVGMFSNAIWPEIIGAHARNDYPWIRNAYALLLRVFWGFALAISGVSVVVLLAGKFGYSIDYVYTGGEISMFIAFALLVIWENIHYSILLGLNCLLPVVAVTCSQAVLASVCWLSLGGNASLFDYLTVQVIALSLGSFWLYPLIIKRKLKL